MRLRQVSLDKYGTFERLRLELETRPGCINLVVAPNGAGKSVLRQALQDVFYPVERRKWGSTFGYKHSDMRLHAEAVDRDGGAVSFGWTRKPGRVFGEGHVALSALLDAVTVDQARRLFMLDTARLRAGGEELAQGGDTLGAALLAGTGELASARTVRAALGARQEAAWGGTRKISSPLNRAVRQLSEARRGARGAVQDAGAWQKQAAALTEQERLRDQARSQHDVAQQTLRQLARVDRTRPHLAALDAAAAWFADHPNAPVLGEHLAAALEQARAQERLAGARLEDADAALREAEVAVAALPPDPAATELGRELEELPKWLGRVEKARSDAGRLRGEEQAAAADAARLLREVGASVAVADAPALLPGAGVLAEARSLILAAAGHEAARSGAVKRLGSARADLAQLEATPAPAAGDAGPLQRLVAETRADGDPLKQGRDLAAAHRDAVAEAARALAQVPGGAAALEDADPLLSELERQDEDGRTAARGLSAATAAADTQADARTAWQLALDRMRAADVPDAQLLRAARARRDEGWRLVARRLLGTPDEPGERGYAGAEPLPLVFERDLRAADAVADRSVAQADQVADANQLRRNLAESAAPLQAAADAVAVAQGRVADARVAWGRAVAQLRLPPTATLADVRGTLDSRQAARLAVAGARAAAAEVEALAAVHAGWAARLGELLGEAGELAGLLGRATTQLDTWADTATDRTRWLIATDAARKAVAAVQREAADAEAAWSRWAGAWAACLARLSRPAVEAPVATAAVLDRLDELKHVLEERAGLLQRIGAIEQDAAAFAAHERRLAARLGTEPDARALIARGSAARKAEAERGQAAKAHDAALTTSAEAAKRARLARQELLAAIAACGAADGPEADRRLALARERARHEQMRDEAERALRAAGDGLPAGALRDEAALHPVAGMPRAREDAEAAQTAASQAAEAAASDLRGLQDTADASASSTTAQDAAHEQAAAAARFGQLLDDWLVGQVASAMLGRAMDDMEASSGQQGLRRVSDAFHVTSGGTHTIVGDEGEKGETVLVAVEDRPPHERRRVPQLSEGLRDQLYLALRLVAIEDHVASAPALPFIADDILQTFDDRRALASLQGLVALSRHVQVIVLTHHEHVAVLAEGLEPGSVHLQRLAT